MKSLLFFLMSFLALIGVQKLAAQYDVEHYEMLNCSCNYVANTIGRTYEASGIEYIISYHQHGTYSEFLISDYANPYPGNVIRMELEPGLFVNDFEILDNEVYFCGEFGNDGIIGNFNINDFLLQIAVPHYAKIAYSETLEKMEIYRDPITSEIIIPAVGITTSQSQLSPTTSSLYIITIDIYGAITYDHFPQINTSNFEYDYWFQDVALTKDYIVTSGVYNVIRNLFIICIIDKNNLTSPYYLVYQENSGQLSDKYEIETLFDNDVALATLNIYSNGTFYTRVHTYDVSTTQFLHSQDIPLEAKNPVVDLQFMDFDSSLIVLHRDEYPTPNITNIVMKYVEPYPTATYSVDFHYDKNAKYASLDRFQGSTFFLASGEMNTYNHTFLKLNKAYTGVPSCHDKSNVIAKLIKLPSYLLNGNPNFINQSTFFNPANIIYNKDNILMQCSK